MLKLLVKLAIAALLANAVYRVGSEYLTHLRFRDSIRESAMFRARTDEELLQRIMDSAEQFEIPLAEEDVTIQREARQVSVQGAYQKPIEIVPGLPPYPWRFSWSVDVITSTLLPPPPKPRS